MITVNTIKCPVCGDRIYSRAHHDMHYCSCGAVAIDGGFDIVKISAKHEIDINSLHCEPFEIKEATQKDLYDDWNNRKNKYGTIKEN
ncbi:MAG: hypothetical protein IKP60_13975 [Treponema sp.]|nr:hypothetical protein [Treponema sp.]